METPETVKNIRISSKVHQQMKETSLLILWMDVYVSQQSNLKSLTRKTYNITMNQQPNQLELVLHREQNQGHSTGEACWKYFLYFSFGFNLWDQN